MKDYYELLEIDKTAGADEIKRAYFAMVRQYPPERFPEEFKALREARDTLSDARKRADYDQGRALPEGAAHMDELARLALKQGRFKDAASMYHNMIELFPGIPLIRAAYARALEADGRNGTAIPVWEALCALEPRSLEYCMELADAYGFRGWRKKSIAQYKRAVGIERGDARAWLGLIDCHGKAGELTEAKAYTYEALDAVEKGCDGRLQLCVCALSFRLEEEDDAPVGHMLAEIEQIMVNTPPPADHEREGLITKLLDMIMSEGRAHMLPYIRRMAATLPQTGDTLRANMLKAGELYDVTTLPDKGYDVLFHDLFATLLSPEEEEPDDRFQVAAMELTLLDDLRTYRPQIIRLKKEFPRLYERHGGFFGKALAASSPEKMILERMKLLKKARQWDDDDAFPDEDDFPPAQQTVRRDAPKINRNDPCPCGSGKKYKKCCGAAGAG